MVPFCNLSNVFLMVTMAVLADGIRGVAEISFLFIGLAA